MRLLADFDHVKLFKVSEQKTDLLAKKNLGGLCSLVQLTELFQPLILPYTKIFECSNYLLES